MDAREHRLTVPGLRTGGLVMRRFVVLLAALIPLAAALAWGQSGAPRKKAATLAPQIPPPQQTPRIPIPGVGGAIPARKKPAAQSGRPILPLLGPFQPGKQPAAVLGPGQNPMLPGLAGFA